MPDTSPVFLEIQSEEAVVSSLEETVDGIIELVVESETVVSPLDTSEWLEIYDGYPGSGGGGIAYTHTQLEPAATWSISHNLGVIKPAVIIPTGYDSPVITDVQYPDVNTAVIIFPEPMTGKAYF